MTADPFGARAMRERVLAAWAASPARFREDANAEEDLALNGYRDRLVVELAQNAADAAIRAGVEGNLLLRLGRDERRTFLVAANTGAPLDADGVQGLATLRASSKREDALTPGDLSVGRFGVGFSAVLTVTDEPAILSRAGGVRFSAADTRTLVESAAERAPELREELARRDGHVPVLRLPFETEGSAPTGFDSAVVLPLRDAAAEELVLHRLAEVGDDLLLALPALRRITIELPDEPPRVIADAEQRWQVWRSAGQHSAESLADRPTEERRRTTWQVTWALPRSSERAAGWQPDGAGVVHAPTPTDEPLDWPGLLIGSFPLDSTRRHVAPGAATDTLVGAAAELYVEALRELAESGRDVLSFVPIGFPSGVLDDALRSKVLELLPGAAVLRAIGGEPDLVKPREAVAIESPAGAEDDVLAALAPSISGLVRARRVEERVLRRLGVQFLQLAEVVEALPQHDDLARWAALYTALAPLAADPLVREALSGLPVPLADGRIVRGARGLLLPLGGVRLPLDPDRPEDAEAFALLGLRAVHPRVAHDLLERLGAVPAGPLAVLEQPSVRAAVENSPDADDPAALADVVLTLVAAAVAAGELEPGHLPWLGDLALPDAGGELSPASALALPGSSAAALLDDDEIGLVADDLVQRWGSATLAAAGVLDDLGVLRVADLGPGEAQDDVADLDGFEDWWDDVADLLERSGRDPADALIPEFVAISDLDAVRPSARADLLARLVAQPATRAALIGPTRVVTGSSVVDVPTYTAWWLTRALAEDAGAGDSGAGDSEPGEAGRPGETPRFADPDADALIRRLLPAAPPALAGLDPVARTALGALRTVDELDPEAVPAVVAQLSNPDVELGPADLIAVTRRIAVLAGEAVDLSLLLAEPPRRVRVIDPAATGGTAVVDAADAVVVGSPMHLQRRELGRPIVVGSGAEALAELLDVRLADEEIRGRVAEDGDGRRVSVPAEVAALLGRRELDWYEHDALVVDGVEVDWWVDQDGVTHASTLDGLARGLAWTCGRWPARHAVGALLSDPGSAAEILVDGAFG